MYDSFDPIIVAARCLARFLFHIKHIRLLKHLILDCKRFSHAFRYDIQADIDHADPYPIIRNRIQKHNDKLNAACSHKNAD